MKVLLVGNPNVGKTTFFNNITKSNERTGNWHGVTVDEKIKKIYYQKQNYEISDLPGIYSVKPLSFEEEVATEILKNSSCNIINIVDANNLKRNLYLTLELKERNYNFILAINFYKEFEKKGNFIDIKKLSSLLGVDCYFADGKKEKETKQLLNHLNSSPKIKEYNYLKVVPFDKIKKFLNDNKIECSGNIKNVCIDLYLKDKQTLDKLKLTNRQIEKLNEIIPKNSIEILVEQRRKYIDFLVDSCVTYKQIRRSPYGISKLDKIILNKFLAFPVFILIMALIFYLTFFLIGPFISNLLNDILCGLIFDPLGNLINLGLKENWLAKLLTDGVFSGFLTVFNFLPQIVLLFFFLSILEDSGYISRLAFVFEEMFNKVGLSGKSVFTILMGFGCITTAVFTTKNMEDKNAKIKSAIMTPFLCCSAKIPVFAVLCGAFFLNINLWMMILMYVISLLVCLFVGAILEKTILKSEKQDFILEFPPYRIPSFKRILIILWDNIVSFILRVGSIIVCFNIIVWVLQNFSFTFKYIPENTNNKSMLEVLGGIIAPIFIPLGFGNYGVASALIVGVMAKELIVSSIAIINGVGFTENGYSNLSKSLLNPASAIYFTPASAISFMIFSLLYLPCISTISVMKKEVGKKWTIFALLVQFATAYTVSFIIYKIAILMYNFSVPALINLLCILMASIIFYVAFKYILYSYKKNRCSSCNHCAYQNNCSKKVGK